MERNGEQATKVTQLLPGKLHRKKIFNQQPSCSDIESLGKCNG